MNKAYLALAAITGIAIGSLSTNYIYNQSRDRSIFTKICPWTMNPLDRAIETAYANVPLTVEFTKDGNVAPPVRISGQASIHIITDKDDRLMDFQVIRVEDKQ